MSNNFYPTAYVVRVFRLCHILTVLPGQPKAIRECLDAVMPAIPHCIDLIGGLRLETNPEQIVAFRLKSK